MKTEQQFREELNQILKGLTLPSNWKVSVTFDGQVHLTFKHRPISFLAIYTVVRQIVGYDYEEVVSKITKHPKLLQAEDIFIGGGEAL